MNRTPTMLLLAPGSPLVSNSLLEYFFLLQMVIEMKKYVNKYFITNNIEKTLKAVIILFSKIYIVK